MYDYVLQYGFDSNSQNSIQNIKNYLQSNGIQDKEREWLPHITIDLYNCNDRKELISKLDKIIEKIKCFDIEFKSLNSFNEETLYIEPNNREHLMKLKYIFDNELELYRLENRREREYIPHVTLCTNDTLEMSKKLAVNVFIPFIAKVKYIWVYSQKMELIKQYEL